MDGKGLDWGGDEDKWVGRKGRMGLWEREKGGKVCGNTAVARASEDENVHYGEWAEESSTAWATKFKEIPCWACTCEEDSGSLETLYM